VVCLHLRCLLLGAFLRSVLTLGIARVDSGTTTTAATGMVLVGLHVGV
jgi:hypothetical protein